MKALSDLIQEKSQDINIQISHAKPMEPPEIEWIKCKKYVDSLTGNFNDFIIEKLKSDPLSIHKKYIWNNCIEITWEEERKFSEGVFDYFTIQLSIIEKEKIVKRVAYYAFNNLKNIVCIREILSSSMDIT